MHLALVLAGPVRRRLRGHPEGPREGPGDVRGGRRGPNMTERWFLGGLCGLLPRRRRQPSGGGARAEPVFPPRERWPPRGRRRHTMAVEALVPPDTARGCNSVHKCPETTPRGRFRRSVYTPASPRPLARSGRPRVPRRRRPLSPRDTRVLGPETHAAGAVTQPPPHTNSQSFRKTDRLTGVLAGAEHLFCVSLVNLTCKHKEQGLMKQIDEQRMSAYESERTKTALKDPGG